MSKQPKNSMQESGATDMQPARRRFLGGVAASAILIPLASLRMAEAAGTPHLSPSDPTAKALDYVEDATKSTSTAYKAGHDCSNCTLYQGDRKAAWGPCAVFPGKDVATKGWCSSYVPMS
jgi:hypothetical protein